MRIFTVSDIHIDYDENYQWLMGLSEQDYKDDVLILAGDISDHLKLVADTFNILSRIFSTVFFIPGNHDLWTVRNKIKNSFHKFDFINTLARDHGITIEPRSFGALSIIPLQGWYDYSFGEPSRELLEQWADYRACIWKDNYTEKEVTEYFVNMNEQHLDITNDHIITFSHFLPRIDLMPGFIPPKRRFIYPALGSQLIEQQIRKIKPNIHIYGHSHVNRNIRLEGIQYINNAFGYPREANISRKKLLHVYNA